MCRAEYIVRSRGKLSDGWSIQQSEASKLGSGVYASVLEATSRTLNHVRAVKSLPRKLRNVDKSKSIEREISFMAAIDHPNVATIYEVIASRDSITIVMARYTGGTLHQYVQQNGSVSERCAALLVRQVLRGLRAIHDTGISHNDISGHNVLFAETGPMTKDTVVKIIDFGLAKRFKPADGPQRCDMFQCGILMHVLLTGEVDFSATKITARKEAVFQSAEWQRVSSSAVALAKTLMLWRSGERATARQALRHPWLACVDPPPLGTAAEMLLLSLVDRMRRFRNHNALKQAALCAMACHIDDVELKERQQVFDVLDIDGDGLLTLAEVTVAFIRAGADAPADLVDIFSDVDADGLGVLDRNTFLAVVLEKSVYSQEMPCRVAFKVFDPANSGAIAIERATRMLRKPVSAVHLDHLLREVSSSGNGLIYFSDFMAMMCKHSESGDRRSVAAATSPGFLVGQTPRCIEPFPNIVMEADDRLHTWQRIAVKELKKIALEPAPMPSLDDGSDTSSTASEDSDYDIDGELDIDSGGADECATPTSTCSRKDSHTSSTWTCPRCGGENPAKRFRCAKCMFGERTNVL